MINETIDRLRLAQHLHSKPSHLYHVVTHGADELDVRQQSGVVARAEADLDERLALKDKEASVRRRLKYVWVDLRAPITEAAASDIGKVTS